MPAERWTPATTLTIVKTPSTLVPSIPLDLYLYGKQDKPTVLPVDIINTSHDVSIETLAIWGASAEDDFAVGLGITLNSVYEAAKVYEEITFEEGWKKLSGRAIHVVYGSGPAARALKTRPFPTTISSLMMTGRRCRQRPHYPTEIPISKLPWPPLNRRKTSSAS